VSAPVDIDASAIMVDASERALSDRHFVYFNNLSSPEGALRHGGDTKSGTGTGDDEQIFVNLPQCPAHADKIVFAVSIHEGQQRGVSFGHVRNAYIRVLDSFGGQEIVRYDLALQPGTVEQAMIFGELYRHSGGWKFRAVGQGFADGLAGVIRTYGIA
jgi:tellurium resistance protein TerD